MWKVGKQAKAQNKYNSIKNTEEILRIHKKFRAKMTLPENKMAWAERQRPCDRLTSLGREIFFLEFSKTKSELSNELFVIMCNRNLY